MVLFNFNATDDFIDAQLSANTAIWCPFSFPKANAVTDVGQ